ncbi:hypothetical protein J32TS6_12430 [Virgibacillus pantothenticus]|uniref:hypothetical protein n=1 Tax=Virgibacillus pantothenticus TaxID=1473 RepID=UPI001B2774E2|nr:hypothetical protein [Virgibacillus pantothenticus]GIP62688.1 hypothetical protein J32TS6_12430 [Virgibacillus pantothenticus]
MSINYKFNQWRQTGETSEAWSPMAYRLVAKNVGSDTLNGYKVGNIIYLHHLKGMTAQEIKETPVGYGISTATIKSVLKGFGRQSAVESFEAYDIAMYMVENEPGTMEQMYNTLKVNSL